MVNQNQRLEQQRRINATKAYLCEIHRATESINRRKRELEQLQHDAAGISGIRYDMDKVQTSPEPDRIVDAVAKCIDIENDINKKINALILTRHTITDQIEQLTNEDMRAMLYKRYVEQKRLEEIAVEMNFSYGYIRRLHKRALLEFDKKYGCYAKRGNKR